MESRRVGPDNAWFPAGCEPVWGRDRHHDGGVRLGPKSDMASVAEYAANAIEPEDLPIPALDEGLRRSPLSPEV